MSERSAEEREAAQRRWAAFTQEAFVRLGPRRFDEMNAQIGQMNDGEISVVWCAGDDCIADVFIKGAVDSTKFKKFSDLLLGDAAPEVVASIVARAHHSYYLNGNGGACSG